MPVGRLLMRSSQPQDRPALYAAQFALSHACWLICYPLAGWLASAFGTDTAFLALTALGLLALAVALQVWPAQDPDALDHHHPDLPPGHPHLAAHAEVAEGLHRHRYVIDALHPKWP
jgi:predicted MFS family arabinose efflux permease